MVFKFSLSAKNPLEESASLLGDLISAILKSDRNGDGKLSFLEIIYAVSGIAWKYSNLLISFKELITAWRTATFEQRKEVLDAFSEHFDLDNDTLEEAIEALLTAISDLISSGIDLRNALKTKTA
jgi:hypothetical protein